MGHSSVREGHVFPGLTYSRPVGFAGYQAWLALLLRARNYTSWYYYSEKRYCYRGKKAVIAT